MIADRMRGIVRQLRALFNRRTVNRELDEELAFHLEMATAHYERSGLSREAARHRAHVAFGGAERYAERVREVRWTRGLEDAVADVRHAVRMLVRRPAFATAVIATLGLGIGGTTAVFSVVDALFLRAPEGVADPSSVRRIYIVRDDGDVQTPEGGPGSWSDYVTMRAAPAFVHLAAHLGTWRTNVGLGVDATQVWAVPVSADYFAVLGVTPVLGRLFTAREDAVPGGYPVALISHAMWQTRFGGDGDVVGRTLLLNGTSFTIVGVLQQGFRDVSADPVDVWLPSAMAGIVGMFFGADWRTHTNMAAVDYIGRLAPGVADSTAVVQLELALRHAASGIQEMDATPGARTASLTMASTPSGTGIESISLWLVLVAGLVLVIACANVVNLLLTRAVTRRRELAVRLALGGGRWRVGRQHLAESMLLAVLGGAAGVLLAWWGVRLLRQFPLPPSAGALDWRLLGFALALSLLTGLIVGLLPAVRSVRIDPVLGLKDARAAGSIARSRTRRSLVVLQVALSLTLVIGAGLFIGSLRQVNAIDGGADIDRLLTVGVDLSGAGYSVAEREAFFARALERLSALPTVERAAIVHFEPFNRSGMAVSWYVPGRTAPPGTEGPYLNTAGVGYFRTAGTRLLAGRTFLETDRPGTEPVAVVNEAMALLLADDGGVVNHCVPFGEQVKAGGCTRIVGVVETQRRRYLDDEAVPLVFLARTQAPDAISWGSPALLVRTHAEPAREAMRVRAALQGLADDLPYVNVRPLEELIRRDVLPFRLGATLFSLFGLLALGLAALGLYAVLAYFVTERTGEIGIRRSLGAPLRDVVSLVLRQGMIPVAIGVALGLAAALAGTRFLAALLFGVDAHEPIIFLGAALFLLGTGVLASVLPAWRAAHVEPLVALRSD